MSNIKVFCRFRPLNQVEKELLEYKLEDQTVSVGEQRFTFDKIFNCPTTQDQVYDSVGRPIIDQLMQGFNATLLMYGQTSSGKTYTMIGEQENPGIIRKTIDDLFEAIQSSPPELVYRIKLSIYEIYNEKIRDLLDATNFDLKVREMVGQGFFVQAATTLWIGEKREILNALQKSQQNRQVRHTNMNDMSSRSHLIFQLTLLINNESEETSYTGQLIMADLAGSENASRAGTQGTASQEGAFINKSLLTLANVINHLSEKSQHIPYRESNLTKILWNGLNKNSMTSLIITCSPASTNESETISTLRFGIRAKMIKTQPKVNKEISVKELEIQNQKLMKELEEKAFLIEQLKQDQQKEKFYKLEELNIELSKQNEQLQEQLLNIQQELEQKQEDYEEMEQELYDVKRQNSSIQKSQFENQQKEQQLEIEWSSECKKYQNELQEKNEIINKQKQEVLQLKQKIQQLMQSESKENDINKIDININEAPNELKQEIDNLKNQLQQDKLRVKQLNKIYESQIQVVTKQNQLNQLDIERLTIQNKDLSQNYHLLDKKYKQVSQDLANRVQKVLDLEEEKDLLTEQKRKLENQLDGQTLGIYEENQRLTKQLQEVNKLYASNIQNNGAFQSQSVVLQQKLSAKNQRIQQLEQQILFINIIFREIYRLKQLALSSSQINQQNQQEQYQDNVVLQSMILSKQTLPQQQRFSSQIERVVKKGQIELL